jgi:membrane-associated protein
LKELPLIHWFIDVVLHLDKHLVELFLRYDVWIYAILFLIVFAETGLVVTPFLPGDSLLFAVGALAALNPDDSLTAPVAMGLLIVAAVLGNTTNYHIGRWIGPPAFSGRYRLLKMQYLRQTQAYFDRHGGKTVMLSRFMPIVRTFAPFVAGVGSMPYMRFQLFNCAGAIAWVVLLVGGGYLFGNVPVVRDNFGFVTLGIIALSLVPLLIAVIRSKR